VSRTLAADANVAGSHKSQIALFFARDLAAGRTVQIIQRLVQPAQAEARATVEANRGRFDAGRFQLIAAHQPELARFGVKRLGVFGSFVRDQQDSASDIDVLVEFEPGRKSFDNFMHLAFYLEDLFGRNVDLLTPESLSPYLSPRIMREVEYVALGS
jgi:uncharacterized protein